MRYGERKTALRDAPRRTTAAEEYHGTDQHQPVSVVPIGPHIVVFTDSGVYTRNDSLTGRDMCIMGL